MRLRARSAFAAAARAFDENRRAGRERCAACAAWWGEAPLLDCAVGPDPDAPIFTFSAIKGPAALALLHALGRAGGSLDEPVACRWPEFAARGKEAATVAHVLDHRVGLPALAGDFRLEDSRDPRRIEDALAAQAPAWQPGARRAYHAMTFGWLCDALVRRLDPAGRDLPRYFADEIAGPLELEVHCGPLPPAVRARAALPFPAIGEFLRPPWCLPPSLATAFFGAETLATRAFANPRPRPRAFRRRWILDLCMPSTVGVARARDLARLYALAATADPRLGIPPPLLGPARSAVAAPASSDAVVEARVTYRCGFVKPGPAFAFGSDGRAFGMAGLGGSLAYADPATGTGYAYLTAGISPRAWDDPRELRVRRAFEAGLRDSGNAEGGELAEGPEGD